MSRRQVDAIVIGAGAAGLAAARELSQAGLTATIIEARDRIGGRILTIRDPRSPSPIELGAEFVHGQPEETFTIIRAAALPVDELPDFHHRLRHGSLLPMTGFWDMLGDAKRSIRRIAGRTSDLSFTEYLKRAKLRSDERAMLINFVESYHAAYLEKVSARFIAEGDEEQSDDKQFRITSGYDDVIRWMHAGVNPDAIETRMNTIACELQWQKGKVTLQCGSPFGAKLEPFRARAALIAVPHAILKSKALRFHPELKAKEGAVDQLQVGQIAKMVFRFRRAFWEEDDFVEKRMDHRSRTKQLNFVHVVDADIPVWWTALPARTPILTGWAGGPKADAFLNESPQMQIDKSLTSLATALAISRSFVDELLESYSMHDWRKDPFSRGAYTYVGVGGQGAHKELARPVKGTLFFAGEATNEKQMGTVAGAIASGKRAALQLIDSLRRRTDRS